MTVTQLRYFIDLAEMQNFTRVAEKHFVAQSVVSYQIQGLEKELDTPLLERTTRKVYLTVAGRTFYSEIRPLVEGIDEACRKVKQAPDRMPFTLGYSRVCYGERFNRMMDILAQNHPEMEFILEKAEPEDGLVERLLENKVDAALFFNPFPTLQDGLHYYDFGEGQSQIICSEQWRLADREVLTMGEIEPNELLACEGMRKIEQILNNPLPLAEDNHSLLLKDLESVFAMIKARRGVAFLPLIDDLNISGLKYIPVKSREDRYKGPHLVFVWNNMAAMMDTKLLRDILDTAEQLFHQSGVKVRKYL
jgi:LysR family transcriptional activator of glutamate synthase operon